MTCFMCQELPKKWSAFADYGVIVMEQKDDRESGRYALCPRCYEKVKGLIWRKYEVRQVRPVDRTGGAGRGDGAQAAGAEGGPGSAVGDADMPGLRGCDTGIYLLEEGEG